jgi:hypothetical protein
MINLIVVHLLSLPVHKKEKITNNRAFSKTVLIIDDDPDVRELYPTRSIGCYIKKPITIENLVRKIKSELE